jgi:HptB-dependent secretion and biofilm anti anti-sigma factor
MHIQIESRGKTAILQLSGHFVFGSHKPLREACGNLLQDSATNCIQLDMSGVEYIDSSALGLLLLMRDKVDSAGKEIQIKGAQGVVLQVLEVARFGRIFEILH